jgi:DNA-binding NarL/FixJ family response regulator
VPVLTKNDEQLLELISHGLSDERIGRKLHLPADAVRVRVTQVVEAMGARNRTLAVALALKTGLIR